METSTISKTSSFHWDTYGLMEYMLVLHPSEPVIEKLLLEKQEFYNRYGARAVVTSRPYITIANFLGKEAMEDTLTRWIRNICNKQEIFELSLNNYSGFPPHTIYARVQDPAPIFTLIRQLKILDDFIRSSGCPPLRLSAKPHLTIARKLSLEVYDRALQEYSQKEFHETFVAQELVLLKRTHEFDTTKLVNKFHFSSIHA